MHHPCGERGLAAVELVEREPLGDHADPLEPALDAQREAAPEVQAHTITIEAVVVDPRLFAPRLQGAEISGAVRAQRYDRRGVGEGSPGLVIPRAGEAQRREARAGE